MERLPLYDQLGHQISRLFASDFDLYPTGFRLSLGKPQNNPIDHIVPGKRETRGVLLNVQSAVRPQGEKGWTSLAAEYGNPNGLWLTRLLLTSHGRVLGEACINDVLPGLRFTVQAEDCSAGASGTAPVSSSCRIINRLFRGPCAKIGAIFQHQNIAAEAHVDAVNGPTLSGSILFRLPVWNNILLGGKTRYDTRFDEPNRSGSFLDFDGSIAYRTLDLTALLQTYRKGSIVRFSLLQSIDATKQIVSSLSYNQKKHEREGVVGGEYLHTSSTGTLLGKAHMKLASSGLMSASYTRHCNNLLHYTICGHVNVTSWDSASHRIGFHFQLG